MLGLLSLLSFVLSASEEAAKCFTFPFPIHIPCGSFTRSGRVSDRHLLFLLSECFELIDVVIAIYRIILFLSICR